MYKRIIFPLTKERKIRRMSYYTYKEYLGNCTPNPDINSPYTWQSTMSIGPKHPANFPNVVKASQIPGYVGAKGGVKTAGEATREIKVSTGLPTQPTADIKNILNAGNEPKRDSNSDSLRKSKENFETVVGAGNSSDPKVWGPIFWTALHIMAVHYPVQASPLVQQRMRDRLMALPYEIPCAACRPHASAYLEGKSVEINKAVTGREELNKFLVEFHNKVNERLHKSKVWTPKEAMEYYSNSANIRGKIV